MHLNQYSFRKGLSMPSIEVIRNALRSGFDLSDLDWNIWEEKDRAGVDRYVLWSPDDEHSGGSVGLLVRYPRGAHSDYHEHLGYELMLVLDGVLEHSNGESYEKGDLIIEEPGTFHQVSTIDGATILAIRTQPTDPRPDLAPPLNPNVQAIHEEKKHG